MIKKRDQLMTKANGLLARSQVGWILLVEGTTAILLSLLLMILRKF